MQIGFLRRMVALCILAAFGTQVAHAEPTGVATLLIQVRPYVGSNLVYVYPQDTSPCGVPIYTIDITTATGKAAYAAALAAIASGHHVMLEATAPCTGLYSSLQSLYALPY